MEIVRRFTNWFTTAFRRQKLLGKLAIIVISLLFLCCLCTVPFAIFSPDTHKTVASRTVPTVVEANQESSKEEQPEVVEPTKTKASTNTPAPSRTPRPTHTPRPTRTPLPPTATPDPNLLLPGTYLVGTDIRPGFYKGVAGEGLMSSCYWERMKDLTDDGILDNDNSEGQYYIEVKETDYALETACELYYLEKLPDPVAEFPQKITLGMYLVGIDIQPGTYKGQAGTGIMESCYWERMANLSEEGIIDNDNSEGQYYVIVAGSDFAFQTACGLERVGD